MTIESFGEIYVIWRLEKGLLSSEDEETPIVITTADIERMLSANDYPYSQIIEESNQEINKNERSIQI